MTTAQINIEAVANLNYTISSKPYQFVEGYQSFISGSYSPYQFYRDGRNSDSAFVARTLVGDDEIGWKTANVPISWEGDSLSFIWACGFGNNLGNEWYDLAINNKNVISFSTKNEAYWFEKGLDEIHLSFTAVSQNYNGANFGYMVLTIPRTLLVNNQGLKIRIRSRKAEREIWYRLFAYRNVIQELINSAHQIYFSKTDFIHMGDAVFTICAPKKYSNSIVQLFNSNLEIAKDYLKSNGLLSKTSIVVPRKFQPNSNSFTIVKVDNRLVDTISWNAINKKRVRAFMDEPLECYRYVFQPGELPKFRWKNEILVENEIGKFPLKVSYYNKDFQKVTIAELPGRYGAMIEGTTPSGFNIKRFVTLFCTNTVFDDYSKNVPIKMNKLKNYKISDQNWERYFNNEERFSFGNIKLFPQLDADAAVFLAGLNDLDSSDNIYNTPRIKDRQWWLKFKQKIVGKDNLHNPLIKPKVMVNDSSILLNENINLSDQYDRGKIQKIKNICQQWADDSGVPNVTLIVHKGNIIFYESFGKDDSGKTINKYSRMWMASITKLLTGILVMQFVEQGLINLDTPISSYLSELKGIDNDKLTIRHLLTHTSGLQFAGEWASDWNYSLENQIAQILPSVDIGNSFAYNRVGYAIAGKVMERITGCTIPQLFYDYLFMQLGMKSAYADNTYGGLYCSSIDLARLGQMMLNKGIYNGYKFFSEQTFEDMLPRKLTASDRFWGIGTSLFPGHGLSDFTFGHGAASGSIFRIDPKNDFIIISARNKPGRSFEKYQDKLIEGCAALINKY